MFRKLLPIAKERGYTKDNFTSHDCAALFQGKSWKARKWAAEKDWRLQFHPMHRFPELFSAKMPDRMISYTWAGFTLLADLPRFLDAAERLHPLAAGGEACTHWLDITFNDSDQNSPDIQLYLSIADELYLGAELHFAFLCGGMVRLALCNHEIVTRTQAGLTAHRLGRDWTDAVIRGASCLRRAIAPSPSSSLSKIARNGKRTFWMK